MPQVRSRSRLSSEGNSLKTCRAGEYHAGSRPVRPATTGRPCDGCQSMRWMEAIRPHSSNGSSRSPPLRSERRSSSYGSGGGGTKALRVSACRRSARATRRTTAASAVSQRAWTPPQPDLERQRGGDHRGPPRRQEEALQLAHLPQGRQDRRERAEEPLEQRALRSVEADRAAEAQEEEDEARRAPPRSPRGRGRSRRSRGFGHSARRTHQVRERGPQEGPGRESRCRPPRSARRGSPRPPARRGTARAGVPRRDAREGGAAASRGRLRALTASMSASAARPPTRRMNPVPG